MGVKCPIHNSELIIDYTSLNMLGNAYPVVTGQCPVCKTRYLSREIMSSSGSFTIDGQRYAYLSEMEKEYPYPFRQTNADRQDAVKNTLSKQGKRQQGIKDEKRRQREYQEQQAKKKEEAERQAEITAQKLLNSREATILEVRDRNAKGLSKSYHAKKLVYLPTMPSRCPNDGEQLDHVKRIHIDLVGTHIYRSSWCCFRCKTAFFLDSEREEITQQINKAEISRANKETATSAVVHKHQKETGDGTTNFAIQENTLYVCKGTIACKKKTHSLDSATGIMLGRDGTVVKINTNYCHQCGKYFIGHEEYMHYRRLYGVMLGNIKVTNGSFVQTETDLAEESILHMCGYSVSQADNLSVSERRGILQYLIDSKVSSKPEIIDYLNFFIRRNGKRQNMEEAVHRWSEDLRWVREYQINRQRYFEISSIRKNR